MQNKKENQKHWKDKLEEAGSFPVASANKDLAWQKLSTRLQKKQRRKSAVWYWLAAACLLPLIVFVMLNYTKDEISTVKNVAHKPAVTQPSVTIKEAQEEKAVTSPNQVITIKKKEPQRKQRIETATIARNEMQPPTDSIITNNTTAIALPKDSINNIASITPTRKSKLKVVHINELNEPYESLPVMAHNANYPRFLPLQLARESIFPEPAKAINKTGFINLRNKSSN